MAGIGWLATPAQTIEVKLLPNNTEIVITVNIKQILSSEIVKGQKDLINQLKAALETRIPDDRAIKYLEKLGFDPFKDLHSVSVAHTGSKDPEDFFVIVEGNFSSEKLLAVAKEAAKENGDNLKISKIGTTHVYEVSPGGGMTLYVAHLSKSLVVTASEDAMKSAIKRSTGVGPFAPKVRELLKTTNDTQSLSVVMTGNALGSLAQQAQAKGLPQNAVAGLAGIDGVSGAITIAKNIDFLLGVGAKDADTAKQYSQMGNDLLPLGKALLAQNVQKNKELAAPLMDVVNTLRLTATGSNVVLRGEVSYDNLQKLFSALGNLKGGF